MAENEYTYKTIANEILKKTLNSSIDDFPGLDMYLLSIARNVEMVGGKLISRQVIALAIETWIRMQGIKRGFQSI